MDEMLHLQGDEVVACEPEDVWAGNDDGRGPGVSAGRSVPGGKPMRTALKVLGVPVPASWFTPRAALPAAVLLILGLVPVYAAATGDPFATPGGVIPGHGTSGVHHFAFSIRSEDYADWKGRLEAEGIVESEVSWPGGAKSLYFRDPDRHLLEIASPGVWSIY